MLLIFEHLNILDIIESHFDRYQPFNGHHQLSSPQHQGEPAPTESFYGGETWLYYINTDVRFGEYNCKKCYNLKLYNIRNMLGLELQPGVFNINKWLELGLIIIGVIFVPHSWGKENDFVSKPVVFWTETNFFCIQNKLIWPK